MKLATIKGTFDSSKIDEVMEWCGHNCTGHYCHYDSKLIGTRNPVPLTIGPNGIRILKSYTYTTYYTFKFDNDDDHTLFTLRWCQ